jgi:hypothetical protein
MRFTSSALIIFGVIVTSWSVHAQGFTPQDLDRLSKQNLNSGAFRSLGAGPPPSTIYQAAPIHQARGLWVCKSTEAYANILAEPRPGAPVIGKSVGEVAAGADRAGYTSILVREGIVGWLPVSAVRPYQNEFNPRATCKVGGIRANGVVTFDVR